MEKIYLTKNDINPDYEMYYGYESQIYEFDAFNLMKIFKTNDEEILKNKLEKIILLSKLPVDFIPIKLVYIDGKFQGYVYKHIEDYQPINCFEQKKSEKYDVLQKVKAKLEELHKYGIIYGDLHEANVLYNGNNVLLCDLDNVHLNSFTFDKTNTQIKHYIEMVKNIDERLDNFALNLLTICYYKNISYSYIFNYLLSKYNGKEKIKTEKISKIISEMTFLKPNYSGELLIDIPQKKLTL